jgi:hypothetical protein
VTFTRHTMTGSLELTDGTRLALDITDARAALEEARSPYSQIDLTTPIPESDVLERIDPRAGLRAQMTLRSDFGEGALASVLSATLPAIPRAYSWEGTPNASSSVLKVDGVITRRNQCTNPGFEVSTSGWTPVSGSANLSVSTVWKERGTRSGLVAPAAANTNSYIYAGGASSFAFGMQPGKTYSLGATLYVPTAQTGTLSTNARKMWVQITTPAGTTNLFSAAGAVTGTTIFGMSVTVPADALGVFVILMNGATNSAANLTYWDSVYVIEGSGQQSYFDGSTPTTPVYKTAADLTARYGGKTAAAVSADYFTPWNSFGVRPPTIRNFNVGLRSFEADRSRGDFRLVFNTDEMLMQDYALVSQTSIAPTTSTVRGAVNLALSKIGAALSSDSLDATVQDIESLNWNPGVTAWDYVEPLVQKAGLRLYCTEQRVWQLVEPQKTVDGFLSLAAENNVTRGSDSISLDARPEDSYYDAVVVEYKWQDVNKVSQVAYDVAGEKERARKVYTVRYSDVPYPGPGAATAILRRSQGRGRVLNVDAISDYATEPGLGLGISLPNSITQTGYVSAVDWQFPEGVMSVKSRGLVETPPDSWTLAPPELLWSTVADDTTWLNYPNISLGGGS